MNSLVRVFLAGCALAVSTSLYAQPLTENDRAEVLSGLSELLEDRYVDEQIGARLAKDLRKSAKTWRNINDPEEFAEVVTVWLREQSGDGHLDLDYSDTPLSEEGGDGEYSASEMERYYGAHVNHGVEKIERLENNIMLLDLRVFPPTAIAGDVIAAAMTVVAQGDALIIDLRKNAGGAETTNLMMGYLLDEGGQPLTGIYNRPRNEHRAATSPSWVPGRRFGGTKPLYVLISKRTFSAAEALAYNLQALGRAVIVGETSGGGAHPFEYRRVTEHFALALPEGRSINPITGANWQGVGVAPDIFVSANDALDKALALAKAQIAGAENQ